MFKTKHKVSVPARFFPFICPPFSYHSWYLQSTIKSSKKLYWFHACSFGEVRALEIPIKTLLGSSECKILITTITNTGNKEAKKIFQAYPQVSITFLPFEIFLPFFIKKLKNLQSLIVMEAELWFMLFFITKKYGAKTILLNARISDNSFKKYLRFRFFYKKIFSKIDLILAQSKDDAVRFQALGAMTNNIEVFGNIKILNPPQVSMHFVKPTKTLILAASTHNGEEELILRAFRESKLDNTAILCFAPRHPERFREVGELLKTNRCEFMTFSASQNPIELFNLANTNNINFVLIDKLGVLIDLYAVSEIVILGGAFARVGGHNPIEPAFFCNVLISGKNIFNQHSLFAYVKDAYIIDESELSELLCQVNSLKKSSLNLENMDIKKLIKKISTSPNQ